MKVREYAAHVNIQFKSMFTWATVKFKNKTKSNEIVSLEEHLQFR